MSDFTEASLKILLAVSCVFMFLVFLPGLLMFLTEITITTKAEWLKLLEALQ